LTLIWLSGYHEIYMSFRSSEKGQILLIVVITMIVALTIGLSVASRTVTELKLSKQNEESQRAFSAAEAGIDRVLQQGGEITLSEALGNNANFSVTAQAFDGSQIFLNNGEEVDQDIGADVWLSDYPNYANQIPSASLTIYWGEEDQINCSSTDPVRPALEISLLQGADVANPSFIKYLYDTCSGRTSGSLDASLYGSYSLSGIPGQIFLNRVSVPISITSGIIMKVIPLYNSTKIAIVAADSGGNPVALPSQGSIIESTGSSGDTVRKIIYFQSYPQLPLEVFPYNIVSQ